ncbi:hypothetical protein PFLUV_G00171560 [Perca fluviatilis]|uniref:TNFR-Cys domain-containing protein n=1 Tax=Perca fluviatilis TaxID=8168 RepID=A0A6A5F230_PERFL|nr:hypothetical protein PFLUV_G00171560 [Perca fluviatilis]
MRTELQSGCFLSVVCLLLVTFEPGAAIRCPTCDPGYFVIKNCSGNEGIQCRPCTDCSASHQETLVNCSTFANSVCSNKSVPVVMVTTAQPAESAAEVWITITVTVSSLLLVLLAVSLAMLSRWKHQPKKPDGPDQV